MTQVLLLLYPRTLSVLLCDFPISFKEFQSVLRSVGENLCHLRLGPRGRPAAALQVAIATLPLDEVVAEVPHVSAAATRVISRPHLVVALRFCEECVE